MTAVKWRFPTFWFQWSIRKLFEKAWRILDSVWENATNRALISLPVFPFLILAHDIALPSVSGKSLLPLHRCHCHLMGSDGCIHTLPNRHIASIEHASALLRFYTNQLQSTRAHFIQSSHLPASWFFHTQLSGMESPCLKLYLQTFTLNVTQWWKVACLRLPCAMGQFFHPQDPKNIPELHQTSKNE